MKQTPWGQLEVSDAHLHFFSPAFFNSLAEDRGLARTGEILGWDLPESPESLADRWVAEMDRHGVDRAVLIASVLGDIDSAAIAVARHPDRFRAIAMVNPVLHSADVRATEALDEGLIHGIFLFPAMHRYSMHDSHAASLLSTLSGRPDTVVYVHCGMLSVGFRKKLGLPCPFDMRYSNPIDLHAAAVEFPRLPFVIPHFGAGYLREALMVAELCPNVYFDTSSTNSWMRTNDIDLATVFRRVFDAAGTNRLLFGTDSSWFPRGWVEGVFDDQCRALESLGVTEESAQAIFAGNLNRLFPKQNRPERLA